MKPINHDPIQPPRPHHEGEWAFHRAWQAFVAAKPDDVVRRAIMAEWPHDRLTQRAATVAASFMVWMGNNNGYALRHEVKRIMGPHTLTGGYGGFAVAEAWGRHNMRSHGVNSGLRCVEVMLAKQHPCYTPDATRRNQVDWAEVPTVTLDDLDVIESMLGWLMTDEEGVRVCREAEEKADADRRRISEERHRRLTLPPSELEYQSWTPTRNAGVGGRDAT